MEDRADDGAEDEEEDVDFDPSLPGMASGGGGGGGEEEGCVVVDLENGDDDDLGFLELGSDEEAILDYASDAECSSPHEDELMGNALEALPELHSLAHESTRYGGLEGQVASTSAEDEEAVMDAISKRTRAHYSLADMTLDQLETFLQESDEDDYFHNVDDEEEYRKFLAVVAQPDQGDETQAAKDDEDEDDEDADFELEIEEALESDNDQGLLKEKGAERRPETREKRREKLQNRERPLGFAKTPLRPLVPYHVVAPEAAAAAAAETSSGIRRQDGCFTATQIGQLHCLIHEHVQLLVQVFALCILDPSRQQVAIETHRMLMELVNRRDLPSFRRDPFPDFFFRPPFVYPTLDREQIEVISADPRAGWIPSVTGPVHSVCCVAPLDHTREFLQEVAVAVQEIKQRHIQTGALNSRCEKEPLFPLPDLQSKNVAKPVSMSNQSQVKKTMAALLVENTKKQMIALVPKGIAAAAQRFIPFFNPALFPHKAPPAATANRLLFTDAEDELLAMGLMAFNTDWNAIQQYFLPTKTTHQIFVRQKNRSSARAPENSIKAVRRMKNSSLTLEEKDSIQEALRCFKYDWSKVWQHAVPHRDPALLPRQWRTAIGTQKSYKSDEASKSKRRLHEASKRRIKAFQKHAAESQEDATDAPGEVTNSEDDGGDYDDAHIHRAFLYDWRMESDRPGRPMQCHPAQQPVLSPGRTAGPSADAGYSSRKRSRVQTIKLAPGLPSLNLPPHVRVLSQSSLQLDAQTRATEAGNRGGLTLDKRAVQNSNSIHPLLLQPANKHLPPAIRPSASYAQPAFHPFFGAKPISEGGSSISVHPLLQQPLQVQTALQRSPHQLQTQRNAEEQKDEGGNVSVPEPELDVLQNSRVDGGMSKEKSEDASLDQEELVDAKDETEELQVQFECEEMGDSDKECSEGGDDKEIEFEEEDIGSENGSLSEPSAAATADDTNRCSAGNKPRLGEGDDANEVDATAMEAAHVLAVIHQNAPELKRAL